MVFMWYNNFCLVQINDGQSAICLVCGVSPFRDSIYGDSACRLLCLREI